MTDENKTKPCGFCSRGIGVIAIGLLVVSVSVLSITFATLYFGSAG